MKDVQIVAYCDGDHEGREPATIERRVSIDRAPVTVIDLCDVHDKVFIELLEFLNDRGASEADQPSANPSRRNSPSRQPGGPVEQRTCPDCGFVSKGRQALGQHTRTKHHKGLNDYEWPS